MRAHPRVAPLERSWLLRLEAIARSRGWPTDLRAVGRGVAELSAAYNTAGRAPASLDPALQAARLLFFFPRDVAKAAAAVRDVPAPPARPLRVLDLGAGLGAATLGLLRAWGSPPAHVRAVEVDREAGEVLPAVLAGHATVEVLRRPLAEALDDGTWDVVVFGQVLCELDRSMPSAERVAAHADLLARARARLAPGGVVVVVEPALRPGTRHLQQVRDALAARGHAPAAPCPHSGPCPMLPRVNDWCHEWLDCPLPEWVQPVAREAGLRSEGLTFARLVLRSEPGHLPGRFRATADVAPSKGRRDVWACGDFGEGPAWKKVGRQDRLRTLENAGFDQLHSGDRFDLDPVDARIGPTSLIRVLP